MNLLKLASALYFSFFALPAFGMLENLDFDQIRENGGFAAQRLSSAVSISPAGNSLTPAEIGNFFSSTYPTNLKTLDLQGQSNVDDNAISLMCGNPAFSRIINLDLRGTGITINSFGEILKSPSLGSIRDLPQISGRYGKPSSMVYVHADPQVSSDEVIRKFNSGNERNERFTIEYRHPHFDRPTASPAVGIKMLEIRRY